MAGGMTLPCLLPSESEEEYSDDDDMSWKVRRSATKCLEALITARPDLLSQFYKTAAPAIILRFKEREENVKSDIFSAYIALLRQSRASQSWRQNVEATSKGDTPLSALQKQVGVVTLHFIVSFHIFRAHICTSLQPLTSS